MNSGQKLAKADISTGGDHDKTLSADIHESPLTRKIEETTARIPSISYLTLAAASMGLSAATTLIFTRRMLGTFFGLWTPTFLLVGIYNKLVKIESGLNRSLAASGASEGDQM